MVVETVPTLLEGCGHFLDGRCSRAAELKHVLEVSKNCAFVGSMVVEREADVPHPNVVEPAFNDVEGRSLFRHEENSLPLCNRSRYGVRDRLRFASSRRSLDY